MADYEQFIVKVYDKTGIDLQLYKEQQMRRRLTSLRNKRGYTTFSQYFDAMVKNETLMDEFMDRMTINVTEFYRNPRRWNVLQEKVIPKLTEGKRQMKIWSAACSTGEKPYSLAIMLKEYFPQLRVTILATDLDDEALKRAKEAKYAAVALKELPNELIKKYFTYKNNVYELNHDIKSMVTFKKHNLLHDTYPANNDLIVCRNVVIYFTDEAKSQVYKNFSEALVSNGVLFVGSTEQIFQPSTYGFKIYDTFFYEKRSLFNT